MSPLRAQMIEAMRLRGFSPRTHRSYLAAVRDLARYHRRSPDQLSAGDLQRYFVYLATERSLSGASCRLFLNAIRFFYAQVLQRPLEVELVIPKKAQRIPELLSGEEIGRILAACCNPKHRMLLATGYGCGLRVSELVGLRVRHIDGERRLLRIEQGKGAKDRLVPIGETLLAQLRSYWRACRPREWLFPGRTQSEPLSIGAAQKIFSAAKRQAGVEKVCGIHGLRHAYATHQLEAGLPVHRLQRLLGHQDIHSTLRYVHWVPQRGEGCGEQDLLGALEKGHG